MNKPSKGFTLVELMVALVIITILASLAYPVYTSFTTRSQRVTGKTELTRIAQLQERFFIDNRIYGTLTQLGFADDTIGVNQDGTAVAEGAGLYDLTITPAPTAISFVAQATATGTQTGDTGCTTMSVTATGVRAPDDCW